MAIVREHVPYYAEIVEIEGFLQDPVLTFGYQEIFMAPNYFKSAADFRGWHKVRWLKRAVVERVEAGLRRRHPDLRVPEWLEAPDLGQALKKIGIREVKTLDLFDHRADYPFDMNLPVPAELRGAFGTVIDIGSLEHVFDTRQCLENLLGMVRVGGHLMLHTPCRGCFNHGLHTFSPECILQTLEVNGFEVRHLRYSTTSGVPLRDPMDGSDVIIWVVGRRKEALTTFQNPQQGRWKPAYEGKVTWQWK